MLDRTKNPADRRIRGVSRDVAFRRGDARAPNGQTISMSPACKAVCVVNEVSPKE